MTQKELLYVEDAIEHERTIIKMIDSTVEQLEDDDLADFMNDQLLTHQKLENNLPQGTKVIRVMPNTPALVGEGMSGMVGGASAKETDVDFDLEEDYDLVFETIDSALINNIADTMYHLVEEKLKEMLKCK